MKSCKKSQLLSLNSLDGLFQLKLSLITPCHWEWVDLTIFVIVDDDVVVKLLLLLLLFLLILLLWLYLLLLITLYLFVVNK